ncbi:MAG TPA: hypothetical protein EYP41_09780 [Anaerolineae bacterium]|nr:hypothetical protein [Anaerolineae bacterium]
MKFVILLLAAFLFTACIPATQTEPVAAPTPTSAYDFSGVHLRLRNESGQDFSNVTLTVGGQTETIGLLPQAATTDYVTFTAVETSPVIRTTNGETVYEWTAVPENSTGLIAGGQFTLILSLENNTLAAGILMENPILHDAAYYAQEMNVSLEEALFRLDVQNEDAISALNEQLQANEADTFAGLWLEHEPEYRVVVAFTRDGEETIRHYVTPDSQLSQLIELRPARYTYAQLLADQQTVLRILDTMQLPVAVAINVQENYLGVGITDRAAFEAALAEADVILPESVVITTFYEPVGAEPPFPVTPVPDVFMPQLKQRDVAFMDALLIGELVVEDSCLRVHSEGANYLVIWQADYYLTDNDGVWEVLDETGAAVARVGETVYMGGGETSWVDEPYLQEPIPETCGGPYWMMGQFLPKEYIPNVTGEDK